MNPEDQLRSAEEDARSNQSGLGFTSVAAAIALGLSILVPHPVLMGLAAVSIVVALLHAAAFRRAQSDVRRIRAKLSSKQT